MPKKFYTVRVTCPGIISTFPGVLVKADTTFDAIDLYFGTPTGSEWEDDCKVEARPSTAYEEQTLEEFVPKGDLELVKRIEGLRVAGFKVTED